MPKTKQFDKPKTSREYLKAEKNPVATKLNEEFGKKLTVQC